MFSPTTLRKLGALIDVCVMSITQDVDLSLGPDPARGP